MDNRSWNASRPVGVWQERQWACRSVPWSSRIGGLRGGRGAVGEVGGAIVGGER